MKTPRNVIDEMRRWSVDDHTDPNDVRLAVSQFADELEYGVEVIEAHANRYCTALRFVQSCLASDTLSSFVTWTLDDIAQEREELDSEE